MLNIKFKVWSYEHKKMYEVDNINFEENKVYVVARTGENEFEGMTHIEDCMLLQYTGLTNMLGGEIYEGHILKYEDNVGMVRFGPPEFYVEDKEGNDDLLDWILSEIIGNVFENEELLNVS